MSDVGDPRVGTRRDVDVRMGLINFVDGQHERITLGPLSSFDGHGGRGTGLGRALGRHAVCA